MKISTLSLSLTLNNHSNEFSAIVSFSKKLPKFIIYNFPKIPTYTIVSSLSI